MKIESGHTYRTHDGTHVEIVSFRSGEPRGFYGMVATEDTDGPGTVIAYSAYGFPASDICPDKIIVCDLETPHLVRMLSGREVDLRDNQDTFIEGSEKHRAMVAHGGPYQWLFRKDGWMERWVDTDELRGCDVIPHRVARKEERETLTGGLSKVSWGNLYRGVEATMKDVGLEDFIGDDDEDDAPSPAELLADLLTEDPDILSRDPDVHRFIEGLFAAGVFQ